VKQFTRRLQKAKEASMRVNDLVQTEAELKSQLAVEARNLQNEFTALQNELERITKDKGT
jgi:hypothetical protein